MLPTELTYSDTRTMFSPETLDTKMERHTEGPASKDHRQVQGNKKFSVFKSCLLLLRYNLDILLLPNCPSEVVQPLKLNEWLSQHLVPSPFYRQ